MKPDINSEVDEGFAGDRDTKVLGGRVLEKINSPRACCDKTECVLGNCELKSNLKRHFLTRCRSKGMRRHKKVRLGRERKLQEYVGMMISPMGIMIETQAAVTGNLDLHEILSLIFYASSASCPPSNYQHSGPTKVVDI